MVTARGRATAGTTSGSICGQLLHTFGHPVEPLTVTFEAGQPTAAPPVSPHFTLAPGIPAASTVCPDPSSLAPSINMVVLA